MKLERRYVEKPWGPTRLPEMFGASPKKRIGEIWFVGAGDERLLAKYLFTDERLSIQVHPNDDQAKARGLQRGKSECWYILAAEPDATLALGLKHEVPPDELRAASLDGSIDELVDWRPIRAGDFFFVPAGTIHAIGKGITLLEFQENSDVTYRLYDYGRPRELHLEDAIAVAHAKPYPESLAQHPSPEQRRTLVHGSPFSLVQSDRDELQDKRRWVIPLAGRALSDGDIAGPGDCLLVEPGQYTHIDGRALIGAMA
jgi:mannose-6-phosphate isomerase